MFFHIISKLLGLGQIRMRWIGNNSVGKKNITEKMLSRQFLVAMINSILTIFIITMKIPCSPILAL